MGDQARGPRSRSLCMGVGLLVPLAVLVDGCSSKKEEAPRMHVVVQTDLAVPKDLDGLGFEVKVQGKLVSRERSTLGAGGLKLPAVYSVERTAEMGSRPIQFSAIGYSRGQAVVLSRGISPIPEGGGLLRLHLGYLCRGSASVKRAEEGGEVESSCGEEETCRGGQCVSGVVPEPSKLPKYEAEEVLGEHLRCFDGPACFTGMRAVKGVREGEACQVRGAFGPLDRLNVALALGEGGAGVCVEGGLGCLVVMDRGDGVDEWQVEGDRLRLPRRVCDSGDARVVLTQRCETKREASPICGEGSRFERRQEPVAPSAPPPAVLEENGGASRPLPSVEERGGAVGEVADGGRDASGMEAGGLEVDGGPDGGVDASDAGRDSGGPEALCPSGMVYIPGGTFWMGSATGAGGDADEQPVHEVQVNSYCMDRTEVTVGDYKKCVESRKCEAPWTTIDYPNIDRSDPLIKVWDSACNGLDESKLNHPVNCVDWKQAATYCRAVEKRLPTEAEWEYEARGGSLGRLYPWGNEEPSKTRLNGGDEDAETWLKATSLRLTGKTYTFSGVLSWRDGFGTTAPVGSFPEGASLHGALDMAGNVWEWVEDWYCSYDKGVECDYWVRVARGGGWINNATTGFRGSDRFWYVPSHRDDNLGFRCSRSLSP